MTKRTVILMLVALLVVAGAIYYYAIARPASAQDCADKPKPKNDFAMAAECDAGDNKPSAPAAPATPH
jgi:hypothetical protein